MKKMILICGLAAAGCAHEERSEPAEPVTMAPERRVAPKAQVENAPIELAQADNTKVNKRDRDSAALTPMDQGNSSEETKISAEIRKALMGDKRLSFTAKNVKVITVGNKVTLRGPVTNDEEKAVIASLARQTVGVGAVDDQLDVKK